MKMLRKYFFLTAAAAATLSLATACSEDDTLGGAKEVYITLNPSSVSLSVGDTVSINASVTNLSGKTIVTPVAWSIDDTEIAEVMLRPETTDDWVVVAKSGAQGKSTKLRATLENGAYAVGTVSVTNHSAGSVTPLVESKRAYRNTDVMAITDTIWFKVTPIEIVDDYAPKFDIKKVNASDPAELTATEEPIVIDKENGLVGVAYYVDRSRGEFEISLTVGGNGDTATGKTAVTIGPNVTASFWDPTDSSMAAPGPNASYGWFYEVRKTIDINSDVDIYAQLMIDGGRDVDIANSRGCYTWEVVSGNSLLITGQEDVDKSGGYDCVLHLRSGVNTGENVIRFCSPDTAALAASMMAYVTVVDVNNDYEVKSITVRPTEASQTMDNLTVASGNNIELYAAVEPLTSMAFFRPAVSIADESVLALTSYEGTSLVLRGVNPGTTTVTLKSKECTASFNVTVTEEIASLDWLNSISTMTPNQSEVFTLRVRTISGMANPYPVKWESSNPAILAVEAGADNASATVTAKAVGTATITASITSASGKTFSVSREVSVNKISDVNFTADNVADAGYWQNDDGVAGFYLVSNNPSNEFWLLTKDERTAATLAGTYSAADFSAAAINGSSATVTNANVTVSALDATNTGVMNGTVTLMVNGNSMNVVITNVRVLFDN